MGEQVKVTTLEELADEELVSLARDGNRAAFSMLVMRYQDRIVNMVAQRIPDREAAYDLAQEVFIKAYRGLAGFQSKSGFYTWLYRIAINTTLSFRRKTMRRRPMLSLDRPTRDDENGRQEVADKGATPGEEALRTEEIEAVRRAIAELDDDFNEVVVLRDIEGLSYDEIAQILQCPVGSIKSRLHRARKRLAEILRTMLP